MYIGGLDLETARWILRFTENGFITERDKRDTGQGDIFIYEQAKITNKMTSAFLDFTECLKKEIAELEEREVAKAE